jgi:predicted acyl esterase
MTSVEDARTKALAGKTHRHRSEVRDGMRIDWDVPIEMDDGLVLRADVFRPVKEGRYPVILSYGPYAKGLAFQDGYPSAWQRMAEKHPDVTAGSSNLYQSWEVVDPEKWVPHDYACVRVDSRGAGCSPGVIDHFSPRETKDFYDCIEWAGVQPWSNGKVGLNGISYYAENQWQTAALQPKHLAAICLCLRGHVSRLLFVSCTAQGTPTRRPRSKKRGGRPLRRLPPSLFYPPARPQNAGDWLSS